MWFRSIYLKTLRDVRVAILGWGIGTGLLVYIVLAAFPSLVTTPQARASLVALAQGFAWLAQPIAVDTPGGYATFKYGPTILIIALWGISIGSRILRGEEERGSLDVLLAVPENRVRVALEKVAAIWTALLGMGVLIAILVFAGGRNVHASFMLGDSLLFALNLMLAAALFMGIALLLSQFTQERGTAAGITGILLLVAVILDMVHRIIPNTERISQLSPVYYYNLSKPLVPGYGANAVGLLVLSAMVLVSTSAAVWFFKARDVGGTVALPSFIPRRAAASRVQPLPVNEWSLRSIYARSLGMIGRAAFWWTIGIAGFSAWMVVIVKQTEGMLATLYQSSPTLASFFKNIGGSSAVTNATILSALFAFIPVALMAFAVIQANRWSSDEEEGRMELVLAAPQPRLALIAGRFGALTTATVIIGLATLLTTDAASAITGIKLDSGNVAVAALTMIPVGLLVAALGYLFSGWLRTAFDTGLLSFLVALWFFISFIGPELNWPDATLRLSLLYYYGTPLLHGLRLADTIGILITAAIAFAIASLRFSVKDIGR
jgi:ABC-2 type transport system permease protein